MVQYFTYIHSNPFTILVKQSYFLNLFSAIFGDVRQRVKLSNNEYYHVFLGKLIVTILLIYLAIIKI